jgi:hypothetical protein
MKSFNLFAFISIVLFSLAIVSCKKDGDDADDNGGDENRFGNNLKTGQVEIKGYAYEKDNKMSFKATAKKITIDWGDGKVEEITPNGVEKTFSHEYANSSDFQTILVNTEDLTEVDFSYVYYGGTFCDIHELRFGNVPKLQKFSMSSGAQFSLTVLEINKAELLSTLSIESAQLTSLDVNGCTALTKLDCYNNKLTSLDVSKCTELTELNCRACTLCPEIKKISSLNVSGCTKLTSLDCRGHELTSLDVSKCTALTYLNCSENQLNASALNSLFNSLPKGISWETEWGSSRTSTISIYRNPGSSSCDISIAEKKGWEVSTW